MVTLMCGGGRLWPHVVVSARLTRGCMCQRMCLAGKTTSRMYQNISGANRIHKQVACLQAVVVTSGVASSEQPPRLLVVCIMLSTAL